MTRQRRTTEQVGSHHLSSALLCSQATQLNLNLSTIFYTYFLLPAVRTVHHVAQQAGSLRKPGAGRQRRAHPAFGGNSRARGRQCPGNTCDQPFQAYCCRRMPPMRRCDLGRRDSEVE